MTTPQLCPRGQPAILYGHCRSCWAALTDQDRLDAIESQHPNAFKAPNRRLEWRVR